jgi:hypothetical protein
MGNLRAFITPLFRSAHSRCADHVSALNFTASPISRSLARAAASKPAGLLLGVPMMIVKVICDRVELCGFQIERFALLCLVNQIATEGSAHCARQYRLLLTCCVV